MHKFFVSIVESLGWIRIVVSPFLIGGIIGLILYNIQSSMIMFVIAILITIIGLLIGVFFATKQSKKRGTIQFLSRVMANPELDDLSHEKTEDIK